MSLKQTLFGPDAGARFRHFFSVMLPIFITQTAIMGMSFFDAVMSGHSGAVQLAGTSIGGNLWMPVFTTVNGILIASTPLSAHLLGAGKRQEIGRVVRHGLFLAMLFSCLCFTAGFFFLESVVRNLGLDPEVAYIAVRYLAGIGIGIVPFFMGTVLRSFIDTLGGTRLTMQVYLTALPVNAALNYILIFGRLGLPPLGGIGAGIATGLTCWFIFGLFSLVVSFHSQYKDVKIFRCDPSFLNKTLLKEYLQIGVPIGLSIFLETSIFGVVAFLVARFGTAAIAASQASMNFSTLAYMIPLSVSMSMTILVGIEAGAKRWISAEQYENTGLAFNWTCALILPSLFYMLRYPIARMYVTEPEVVEICARFITYGCLFIMGDAVAAPIQGILRGYKDVNLPFCSSLIAYWAICAPLGLFFDYSLNHGPYSYWQSLDIGIFVSAMILFLRLQYIRKKVRSHS